MNYLAASFLLCCSFAVHAQSPVSLWRAEDGTALPETEARRTVSGLGVWLILTPGSKWKEEVQSPAPTTPDVLEASEVARGETLTTLIFLANAKPDEEGLANIVCDITVTQPDGTVSTNAPDTVCLREPLIGPPLFVRLATPKITFRSDAAIAPPGLWQVDILIKDMNRGIEVPVRATFRVLE